MAVANFGILSSFDHNMQTWKTYKNRIAQWFIANDINEEKDPAGIKRRAILLSALTEDTYKLTSDLALPKDVQAVPYEDILLLLDTHFTPKQVGFGERHNFYAAVQQPCETPSQWAARLRGLTANCGFSNIEEALRDKFIMGMEPGAEKERLYAQELSSLTLSKAIEMTESLRKSRDIVAVSAQSGAGGAFHEQVFKMKETRGKKEVKCAVCGFTNHKTSECRFSNYVCRKCKVKGHLRRMCKAVNFVESSTKVDDGSGEDDGTLFNIRSFRGEPMVETVLINGKRMKFEIDSGSAVSVISEKTFKKHLSDVPLSPTKKRLISYTSSEIYCVGSAAVSMRYAERERPMRIYVVPGGGPPLLGRDFLSQFRLEISPVNYCRQIQNEINSLQKKYPETFSGGLGHFKYKNVKLVLKDAAQPKFFKARPMAFALRGKVDKEIDRMVDAGILKPVSHSEFASPIVPVLKKDGTVRICADYSVSLNKQLVIDQYPLPTAKELFSKLYGGKHFTKLDLSMAYNQFGLDEESQKLTCINTHRGLYVYTRLVFGLACAPAVFQRAMEGLLAGIPGVLCLLDDILITGENDREHMDRLKVVLQRLQDAGLTLKREKCDFFKDEITYLGFVINKDGLKKSPEKIKAVVEAPVPANVAQLQSFLGLVNYYRIFIPAASSIMSPLYDLLRKGCKWQWEKVHDDAFVKVKEILSSEQVLAHFNQGSKIILTVDASPTGLGAILSQIDESGLERPISYASRTLSSAEKKYSQIQKEATAIIFGVRRFHQYLYGRASPFVLRTDHKPLLSIFGPQRGIPEVSANRLQRYALFLSGYNFIIEYVRSKDNAADYLSRAYVGNGNTETADIPESAAYVCFVTDDSLPITFRELQQATASDTSLSQVIKYVSKGWPRNIIDPKIKPYFLCRLQISYENGCLLRGHKVIIPESLRLRVITELHNSHLGIVKTKAEARSRFWFPGIDKALESLIGACEICLGLRPTPPRARISPWELPPQPFYRVHIDLLGPLNKRMYLVIVDAYSKWVEVDDMNTTTTSTAVIEKLYEFMSRFGIPHTLVSDNGTSFCSAVFEKFCTSNGIVHLTSPAYHPASNGQAESYVKIIKKGIKTSILSSCNLKQCKLNLLKYLFHYRNSIHSTTGSSPTQLVFGRKIRSRLDLLNPKPPAPASTELVDIVRKRQCSQVKCKGGKEKDVLNVGDLIMYKGFTSDKNFFWLKGTVEGKLGNRMYIIRDSINKNIVKKHVDQIVKIDSLGGSYAHFDFDQPPSTSTTLPSNTVCTPCQNDKTRQATPCKVTLTRGVRRRAQLDDDDDVDDYYNAVCSPSQCEDDKEETVSNVTMTRGDRRPIPFDLTDAVKDDGAEGNWI